MGSSGWPCQPRQTPARRATGIRPETTPPLFMCRLRASREVLCLPLDVDSRQSQLRHSPLPQKVPIRRRRTQHMSGKMRHSVDWFRRPSNHTMLPLMRLRLPSELRSSAECDQTKVNPLRNARPLSAGHLRTEISADRRTSSRRSHVELMKDDRNIGETTASNTETGLKALARCIAMTDSWRDNQKDWNGSKGLV